MGDTSSLLRRRTMGASRVTTMELFFDLVFVFATTQLSHLLLAHLTVDGALRTALLLVAVWWAWIDTAWATNWLDPTRRATRMMLLGAMFTSLIMAAAIPEAFQARGLAFAAGYAVLQVGRSLFVLWATKPDAALHTNFQRFLAWRTAGAALWVAGGIAHDGARIGLWIAAVTVDTIGPLVYFVVPGLGRSHAEEWSIDGGHLAERCQLFLIVAFGESVLLTGATFGDLAWTLPTSAALAVCFAATATTWWIYFDAAAERSSEMIAVSDRAGVLGRSAYTYWHLPMVAGIIVAAVGDDLIITDPLDEATTATAVVTLGGPALFLAGHAAFTRVVFGHLSVSRVIGAGLLVAAMPAGARTPPLIVASA
ncbi:MAG: low temperature requirement protein A, partial [Ilumatobacteraceae bacterium]